MIPKEMRALEISRPGGPEVLTLTERPVPAPKPHEILIKVAAAGVNRPDCFQRAGSYPEDFPLRSLLEGRDLLGRGGSAILAPDGSYLAGPLYGEEGILYAELDPDVLLQARQRFDPAGHYHRPDVLRLSVSPIE